jgi:hypothetical protein
MGSVVVDAVGAKGAADWLYIGAGICFAAAGFLFLVSSFSREQSNNL